MPTLRTESLTFAELERRIQAIPDGPIAVLNAPGWMVPLNVAGTLGIVVGLLPSLLVRYMEPQMWMVGMAKTGLWLAAAGYALPFLRSVFVLVLDMTQWKQSWVAQMDHDQGQFHLLVEWLSGFPAERLQALHQFALHCQQILDGKLALLVGGIERLGILPVMVSLLLLLRSIGDLADIPIWQTVFALFLPLTWLIGWLAASMRLRMRVYTFLLSETIARSSPQPV